MILFVLTLAVIGLVLGDVRETKYEKEEKYYATGKKDVLYSQKKSYHGRYDGKCKKDGFYYKDAENFVI